MRNVEVITFHVGQGLFNLVTGRRNDGELYTGVFDCGNFEEYGPMGVAEACDILNQIEDFTEIDDVVISHQDIDHWRNFTEFFLNLNGCSYSRDSWYFVSGPEDEDVTAGQFSDNFISRVDKDGDGNIKHIVWHVADRGSFEDSDFVRMGANFTVSETGVSAQWKAEFYTESAKPYKAVITQKEGFYEITFWNLRKQSMKAQALPDEIYKAVVNMIAGMCCGQNDTERLYRLWRGVYRQIVFDYAQWDIDLANPVYITKRITDIYLGGLAYGTSYWAFNCYMGLFADNVSEEYSYLRIYPDSYKSDYWDEFTFEENIRYPSLKQDNIYKNATSQVTIFFIDKNHCLVFPGDATVHVFSDLAETLKIHKSPQIELLLAPHHGSGDTNFCRHKKKSGDFELDSNQPFSNLLAAFPPKNIFISADRKKFGHPSKLFMDTCERFCRGAEQAHPVLLAPDNWYRGMVFGEEDVLVTEKAIDSTETAGSNLIYRYPQDALENGARMRTGKNQEISQKINRNKRVPSDDMFLPYGGPFV